MLFGSSYMPWPTISPPSCEPWTLPKEVEHWSLTTIRENLVKIGAKIVAHGRYVTFHMAEVAVAGARARLREMEWVFGHEEVPARIADKPFDFPRIEVRGRQPSRHRRQTCFDAPWRTFATPRKRCPNPHQSPWSIGSEQGRPPLPAIELE
jgi:hypothetical protein